MKQHLFKYFRQIFSTLLATILTFSAAGYGQKVRGDFYAHLPAAHARAVKDYIGRQKALRPAQISDCRNKFGLESLRENAGKSAHPYYAAADFDRDGIGDFAVVLYDSRQRRDARFRVMIFGGEKSGSYRAAYKSENIDLRQGGIWTDGFGAVDGKTSLTAGIFETDDVIWIEWEGGRFVTHDGAEVEN